MINKSTLTFLEELKLNNNKPWFDEHRQDYEKAKANFIEFTNAVIKGIEKLDDNIAKANLDAKKCISRINRDVRFSKNKEPYKTNFFALINQGGKKANTAAYYLELEPENNSFVGGGVYMPMPPDLQKFRQEIDYGFEEWKGIVESKSFKKIFPDGVQSPETLVRTPKGYDEENPAIGYLKMKGYYTFTKITDADLISKEGIIKILNSCKITKPMIDFLNRAL